AHARHGLADRAESGRKSAAPGGRARAGRRALVRWAAAVHDLVRSVDVRARRSRRPVAKRRDHAHARVRMARGALERARKDVESRLRGRPAALDLKFERARLLDKLGRTDEARLVYVDVLKHDAAHFGALNDLGMLLYRAGLRAEALTCFQAAGAA